MAMPVRTTTSSPLPERSMWTVADLERLPDDGNRYEILHGELLVTPMPTNNHQGVAVRLPANLYTWCRAHTGWTGRAAGGVYVGETTWLEPDIAVYPTPEYSDASWRTLPAPLLVVEVLSPSTRKRDRHRKRTAYLAHGVGAVWIVDAHTRTVERWTKASGFPDLLGDPIAWSAEGALPAMSISGLELFGPTPERRRHMARRRLRSRDASASCPGSPARSRQPRTLASCSVDLPLPASRARPRPCSLPRCAVHRPPSPRSIPPAS